MNISPNATLFAQASKEFAARTGTNSVIVEPMSVQLQAYWQEINQDRTFALAAKTDFRKWLRPTLQTQNFTDSEKAVFCAFAATVAVIAGRHDFRETAMNLKTYYSNS